MIRILFCIVKDISLTVSFLFTLFPLFSHGQKLSKVFKLYAAREYRIPLSDQLKVDCSKSYLVKFNIAPNRRLIEQFEILKVIDNQHYIVRLKDCNLNFKSQIEYIAPSNDNWKATARLLNKINRIKQKDSILIKVQTALYVGGYNSLNFGTTKMVLSDHGAVVINVKKTDWESFLNQKDVLFADILVSPKEEIQINNLDLNLNRIRAVHSSIPELKGEGINVSIKENLFDTTDVDIRGRYVRTPLASKAVTNHATAMATIIGGNGNSYGGKTGVAPMVKLSSSDFKYLLPDNIQDFRKYNISIQNHSYGTGIENFYGIEAVAYDKLSFEADTLIHIFSSGNIGNTTPSEGIYSNIKNIANLSGTFKQAKNVLVVGGTDNLGHVETMSSKGPAFDGRIKPEIVAFGVDGTSGAAAIVSGTCALLQDLYQKLHKHNPSSALIRAILINSANDVGPRYVDYFSGFGSLNAIKAASIINENRFFKGVLSEGIRMQYHLSIPDSTKELKITLVWNDPPASINSYKALVNDLDLSVFDVNGEQYFPWVLNPYPYLDSLTKAPLRRSDNINTVEQVTIDNPNPGQYTIDVKFKGALEKPQPFYVTYQVLPKGIFKWNYPNKDSQLMAGEMTTLSWDTSISGQGILSFSIDGGITWNEIDDNIDIEDSFVWRTPNVFKSTLLKLETNGKSYISDAFSISTPVALNIGFNCIDSLMLHWKPIPGALSYQIFTLNADTLKLFAEVTDTSIVIKKDQIKDVYFSGSAKSDQHLIGIKGGGVNYTVSRLQCYVKRFLADVTTENKVRLTADLGTVLNLERIVWERKKKDGYVEIGEIKIDSKNIYQLTDENPIHGTNTYRLKIVSVNGAISYSEPISATVLVDADFLIFPNPVNSIVNVLSHELAGYEFKLMDVTGRLISVKKIEVLSQAIDLSPLTPGIYLYGIFKEDRKLYSGKLIKN